MHYFYQPDLLIVDKQCILIGDEAHHAIKVLRIRLGEDVSIIDGKGKACSGKVGNITKTEIRISINEVIEKEEVKNPIHLAIAQLKNKDRLEWLIEKATEASVSSISIFKGEKSEKFHFNQERMDKIIISALKQSGNLYLPHLRYFPSLKDLISSYKLPKYIAWTPEEVSNHLVKLYRPSEPSLIVIGPEGDFSDNEINYLKSNPIEEDITFVSLGEIRYRAETAGISALFMMKSMQYNADIQ